MQDCIFCRISLKQLPANFLLETENLFVIRDIAPKAATHLLIIPKAHRRNLKDFSDVDAGFYTDFFVVVRNIAAGLSGSQSFKLICNNEAEAGQVVFHQHTHFLSEDNYASSGE